MIVHVVVPEGIDDPARPSGGNSYDRRICHGLAALGWTVHEHPVAGGWPHPDDAARAAMRRVLADLSDAALVLLDGLIASTVPEVLTPERDRLRLVVLVHMPLLDVRETAALAAATAIVTTSDWTRRTLLERYRLDERAVHVAEPGVDLVPLDPNTPADAAALLCVAAVTPAKGHDILFEALSSAADLSWRCTCVGALDRDPGFVTGLRRTAQRCGIAERVRFAGPRTGADLDRAYATAGVLLLASRAETYGMVVAEALACGLPVIATAVGGVPETVGYGDGQRRPGLLVTPGDASEFGAAVRRWLTDEALRDELRQAARERRSTLRAWSATVDRLADVLRKTAPC